jgi:hypothetical protein
VLKEPCAGGGGSRERERERIPYLDFRGFLRCSGVVREREREDTLLGAFGGYLPEHMIQYSRECGPVSSLACLCFHESDIIWLMD